jgi:tetratricopeptide (TPR) repeat protein
MPNAFTSQLQRALALHQSGEIARALVIYRQLLKDAPNHPQLLFLLGSAEIQRGQAEAGVQHLAKSLQLSPGQPRAHCNLGTGLHDLGRDTEAVQAYDQALAANPGYAMAHNNSGVALLALGRTEEALAAFERAIAIEPRYAEAYNNRGGILRSRKDYAGALASFERAIALNPGYAAAHCNRGTTLNELNRPQEALASFGQAIALDAELAKAHCGQATALFSLKRLAEARRSNARALALDPGFAEAQWNEALFKLITGEFSEGWELHEARKRLPDWNVQVPFFLQDGIRQERPFWKAEEIAGKTLLVQSEQGFGDFIQFARYLPQLCGLGARVIVEAGKRLLPLLATLEGKYEFVAKGGTLPAFDYYCPVMSLARAFKTTLQTVPASLPYLFAAPDKRREVLARLGEKTAPRIGLVWSGNPRQPADRVRSVPLEKLARVLAQPFAFHALQKEIRPEDEARMQAFKIADHRDEQNDFSDAAALIAAMDLIVTVDTVVAHLAGAMGKPVWILLPWMADWRWLLEREDSPWYPSARLFRQEQAGDWDGVCSRVAAAVRKRGFAL